MTDSPELGAPEATPEAEDSAERTEHALEEERQRSLRLRADFENYRRRTAGDQGAARQAGARAALLPLLPVVDALDRALEAGSTDPMFYEGVVSTERLLLAALREAGAEPFDSVGRPFDPRLHEAVATTRTGRAEPGTVVRETQRGWRLGDELLRPARVVVAATASGGEARELEPRDDELGRA
jgi:molecular chaperone GrpE